jgi:hypothetical protein
MNAELKLAPLDSRGVGAEQANHVRALQAERWARYK